MPTALNSNPSTYVRRKKVKKAKWVFVPQTYTIQLFYNLSDGDEGMLCVDQKAVTTELSGDASFDFTAPCPLLSSGTVTAAATRSPREHIRIFGAPDRRLGRERDVASGLPNRHQGRYPHRMRLADALWEIGQD